MANYFMRGLVLTLATGILMIAGNPVGIAGEVFNSNTLLKGGNKGSDCWDVKLNNEITGVLRNTVGTYGMIGRWCHNGSRPTSWKVLDAYGETSTPGWTYKGHTVRYYNAGWEIRMIVQYTFVYGVSLQQGSIGKNETRCLQLRGGRDGLYSYSNSCSF